MKRKRGRRDFVGFLKGNIFEFPFIISEHRHHSYETIKKINDACVLLTSNHKDVQEVHLCD